MTDFTISLSNVGDLPLRFTLDAFKTLPSEFGGVVGIFERVNACDIAVYSRLICVASGQGISESTVFGTDLLALRPRVVEYLELLFGGAEKRSAAGYA
ncbi:hypothetical protein [Tardiphaga sp. 841_E9_N1_2]|uniref:hypothetical protein n=1 Tax=Tardiphaga sp. 841_E9_N1_2 TaxID=3240762 RepID=UPI003F28D923